jgi:hypothetical protein
MILPEHITYFMPNNLINQIVEFLGIWERLHNQNFNYGEFATIKQSKLSQLDQIIEWAVSKKEKIDNSKKDIAGVYYESWKTKNEVLDELISHLQQLKQTEEGKV